MDEYRFTFEFKEISDNVKQSSLSIIDHRRGKRFNTQASINDRVFLERRGLQVKPHVADLIDLAVSIYVADRWARRKSGMPRVIHVSLPVRTDSFFNSTQVQDYLRQMLNWFTGDVWTFEFSRLPYTRRTAELQTTMLKSSNEGIETEVALWSGGLDALAGLCNRIDQGSAERFLLIGTGAKPTVWGVQKKVFDLLKDRLDEDRLDVDTELIRLHIEQSGTNQRGLRPDYRLRARGAVFMLLGSAYALLEEQNALAVYENGPGALNLPFRASEVGLDHSRGVHPLSLQMISQLATIVMETPFVVHNPFLGCTKAEMCRVLDKMNMSDIVWESQSCDRSPRNKISQCGSCSSCLLRRQALLAAGIRDQSSYLLHLGAKQEREKYLTESHLLHMMHQSGNLRQIVQRDNAWAFLRHKNPTLLGDVLYRLPSSNGQDSQDIAEVIISVLRRYANEWIIPSVQKEFETEYVDISRVR